jgi:hypothetical protein
VPNDQVFEKAGKLDAIPYGIPGAEYSHEGDRCTFDYLLKKYNVNQPELDELASIVRGADTDRDCEQSLPGCPIPCKMITNS